MLIPTSKIGRSLAPAALILATLVGPRAAAAQSYDPSVWGTSYDSAYVIDASNGWVSFGDGSVGQTVPSSSTVAATYTSGGGAAGNTATEWSEIFGCWIRGC
jgi:hypothetical protein